MQFHWAVAWPSSSLSRQSQRWNCVHRHLELLGVVDIGPRNSHRQRYTVAVNDDMALRAQLAAIRRILASRFAPPGAGTLALSSDARVQSIRPASCSRCRSARCKRLQTPARCQSRKRRQHVMPLPQPSSWGSISHGMPLFKTNTMPVRAARSVIWRGRPPLGLGGSAGKSGAMISHNPSLMSGVLMPPIYHTARVLLGALMRLVFDTAL
jgi:hypothetical protein